MGAEKGKGDLYWVRTGSKGSKSAGIVVATTWMLCRPAHFKRHSDLYASCNWDSLISHPNVVNLWFPNLAKALALRILDKLTEEVQARPRPIVFATFSGGLKSCLYKIFQILDEDGWGADPTLKKYRIVRDCYAGQIQDSSPVDYVSENGANFVSHPIVTGAKERNVVLTWSAHALAKALDFFLLRKFEADRADMWTTLDKSGAWGPVLVLCSKDDDLAPFEVIKMFCSRLSSIGCNITLVVWDESQHVAHLKKHPEEYSLAIKSFLSNTECFLFKPIGDLAYDVPIANAGRNASLIGSTTSGWNFPMKNEFSHDQSMSSVRLQRSETSSDGETRCWIPSRI